MIDLDEDKGQLSIAIPYARGKVMKKDLGARWDGKSRSWLLAPTSLNVLRLCELYGVAILNGSPDEIVDLAFQPWGFKGFTDDERATAQAHPAWNILFPSQREGVEYLFCNPHGAALCALTWGGGKGAVATVTSDLLDVDRILILAPLTLALTWRDEITRWSTRRHDIKRATSNDRSPLAKGVTIANHEVLHETILRDENREISQPDWVTNARKVKEWIDLGPHVENERGRLIPVRRRVTRVRRDYLEVRWQLIIVDESVLLKNRKAVKTDVLMEIVKTCDPFVFMLSGSPTTKYRDDLFRQLQILHRRAFASYWRFTEFFCIVDKDGWGWTIEGDRPNVDPHHYLRDYIWVKSQDEAMPGLPEYVEQHMQVEATEKQRIALDQMLEDWIVDLEDEDPEARIVTDSWLARFTRLQQITSNLGSLPKPNGGFYKPSSAKEDVLATLIENGEIETPLLVWTWFVETTYNVTHRLDSLGLSVHNVVGSDTRAHKDGAILAYKNNSLDALVMQMGVGKFGHTFVNTRTVFYHDRSFDSDAWLQSLHRVRRIGLLHRPTLIVPKIPKSADEIIDANLDGKLRSIAGMTNADLGRLLRSLANDCALT